MERRLLVIQEHHTKRNNLHWDVRFEADGELEKYNYKRTEETNEPMVTSSDKVLRSFVIPKHEFPEYGRVRMVIQTEDHPWEYKDFEGTIPSGYGAGEVKLIYSDYVNVSTFTDEKITFEYEDVWYTIFKTNKGFLIKRNS